MPAWLTILCVLPIAVLAVLMHYYCVSRVLDGWYEREVKPTQERLEVIEGQLRQLSV